MNTMNEKQELLHLLGKLAESVVDARCEQDDKQLDLRFVSIVDQISLIEERVENLKVIYRTK